MTMNFRMKSLTISFFFSIAFFSNHLFAVTESLTLLDVYRSAVQQSDSIQAQQARQSQFEEKWTQSRAQILPTLQLVSTYQYQDLPARPSLFNSRINLNQPLFKGMGEYAALRAARSDLEAQSFSTQQARVDLYQQVIQSFFAVLLNEREINNISELLKLIQQRKAELRQRFAVGRSRKGDLLSTEAQEAQLFAQQSIAQGELERSRIQLASLTGVDPRANVILSGPNPYEKIDLEYYLGVLEDRPDITSGRLAVSAAEELQSVARSGHWPSLDFNANYYLYRASAFWENVKWDVGLNLSMPIFQGGGVSSRVREASFKQKEREAILTQTRRQAEREIRSAYQAWQSSVVQEENLKKAVALANKNYQEQSKDYRLGLVTHLDLIQALNALQETKRSLDRTQIQSWSNRAMLDAAAGKVNL